MLKDFLIWATVTSFLKFVLTLCKLKVCLLLTASGCQKTGVMAEKEKYKETQTFGYPEVWMLIGGLQVGLIIRFVQHWLEGSYALFPFETLLFLSAPLVVLMVFLWKLRVEVRVSAKKIAIHVRDWYRHKRAKIPVAEIEEIELIDTPPAAQWVGGNISFDHAHQFSLQGRRGLFIRTREGEEYFVGVSNIQQLKPLLRKLKKKLKS